MINEKDVKLKINYDYYWGSQIEYENCYYSYKMELNSLILENDIVLVPTLQIYDKSKYVKRRRFNFNYYSKVKVPYQHREIIRQLLDIFEEKAVFHVVLSSNNITYKDIFSYMREKTC